MFHIFKNYFLCHPYSTMPLLQTHKRNTFSPSPRLNIIRRENYYFLYHSSPKSQNLGFICQVCSWVMQSVQSGSEEG